VPALLMIAMSLSIPIWQGIPMNWSRWTLPGCHTRRKRHARDRTEVLQAIVGSSLGQEIPRFAMKHLPSASTGTWLHRANIPMNGRLAAHALPFLPAILRQLTHLTAGAGNLQELGMLLMPTEAIEIEHLTGPTPLASFVCQRQQLQLHPRQWEHLE